MRKIKIKLADLLRERKMTQLDLANLANLRPNTVSNLARGYVDRLSIDHLEKICCALDLKSISELIELEDDNNEAPNSYK